MGVPCTRCAHGDTLCFPVIFPAPPKTYRGGRTRLHQTVHCVVRIQQFINKRNVKYRPFGKWPHFPKRMWKQETATEILNPLMNRETQGNSVARGARGARGARTRCKTALPEP